MKRKTVKEIFAESFRELAEKKAVNKITVAEIADNCGYSTTTFYRQFKDKYDLMAWEYTRQIEEIIESYAVNHSDWQLACLAAAGFFASRKDYLINLFQHTSGYDSFVYNMKQIHYKAVSRYIESTADSDKLSVKTEMYIRAYCYGSVDISCDWIMGKYDVSTEELAEVYVNSIPDPIREYLVKP